MLHCPHCVTHTDKEISMKKYTTSFLTLIAVVASSVSLCANTASEKWLIIGGTRGAGYALAQELESRMKDDKNLSCSLFVNDEKKAKKLFGESSALNWTEGKVATDIKSLEKAAQGATYIVIAATFPYKIWEKSIGGMIDNCLTVARKENSTLIYLGRIFKYGKQKNITEESEATPNSTQGRVLKKIEEQLEQAGTSNLVKTRIICQSYPFGPNVGDGLLDTNFREMLKSSWLGSSGKFEWIARGDVSLQLTYTPDLARFIIDYVKHDELSKLNFHRINFEGIRVPSINKLGTAYAKKAGVEGDYNLSLYSHAGLTMASWVRPEATRAKDVYYAFENELILDGTLRRSLFKDYELTSLDEAVNATYQWYNNHK